MLLCHLRRGLIGLCLGASSLITPSLLFPATTFAQSQVNAADLRGTVSDDSGKVIAGAKVMARDERTGFTREATTNDVGVYQFIALPPGSYEITVESPGFARAINRNVILTIGAAAQLDFTLRVGETTEEVVVTADTQVIEGSRTSVAETINQRAINNLPTSSRSYVGFTLLTSTTTRDNQPKLGVAPTSGLNFGGQRARANNVSIDGADATDSATNGVRATVSQEAVQEFQILTNSFAPEFGRASSAVINIVSKGGGNELRGNVFAFLRDQAFSANNAFAGVREYPETRFQGGFTLGGPIVKDKTFFFLSFETQNLNGTGFNVTGRNGFGFTTFTPPALLASSPNLGLSNLPAGIFVPIGGQVAQVTPQQAAFLNAAFNSLSQATGIPLSTPFTALPAAAQLALLNNATFQALNTYYFLAREGSSVGLTGRQTNGQAIFPTLAALGITNPGVNSPVPLGTSAFRPMTTLLGNYTVRERTFLPALRIDHRFSDIHQFFVRVSVTPSTVRGIPSNGQNQPTALNEFTRTGFQGTRDVALVAQNLATISPTLINESRFQFSRRGVDYGPQGPTVGVEVPGIASFGREPFSPARRVEKRWQVTNNLTKIAGNHTLKFGADFNLLLYNALFEVNFGGVYAFPPNQLFPAAQGFPAFSGVQSYGLGLPESYVQNVGNPNSNFNNPVLGVFAQDSWKIRPNFTFNYGVRYDVQYTKQIQAVRPEPFTGPGNVGVINMPNLFAAGEEIVGIQQGIPRDYNNIAPRVAFAWDPFNNGKTVVRAAYGLFYGTPLAGLIFLSDVVDGAQSPFLVFPGLLGGGALFRNERVNIPVPPLPGYQVGQQRYNPLDPGFEIFNGGPIRSLLFSPITSQTLHLNRGFEFDYTQQGNLSIERQLGRTITVNATYSYIRGLQLVRPRNVNQQNLALLQANAQAQTNPIVVGGQTVGFFGTGPLAGLYNPLPNSLGPGLSGLPAQVAPIGRFLFNDFRRTGPNLLYTAATLNIPVAQAQQLLAALTNRFNLPRLQGAPFVPFGSAKNYESSGSSIYHALTLSVNKRFSNNFQFLASYTWSHAIDDSTDVQTLQEPQDNSNPRLDRSNSNFDQRHRFIFSAVVTSPFKRNEGAGRYLLADWTFAPIVEAGAGRPYTLLIGVDQTQVNSSSTARPNFVTSCPPGTAGLTCFPSPRGNGFLTLPPDSRLPQNFGLPVSAFLGNVGRNAFTGPNFISVDFRLARKFYFSRDADATARNLEFIFEMFNALNRVNITEINPNYQLSGAPTLAAPPRQIQFALKFNF
ncbi:carboxypeptidase-like regulatory domain-containing protein [Chloracidobacterium aggregatum]|uniref:TonB-dependent receptor n=1 Tax=Chloracidobacterium sp. N TaxID=2821540 RepID=A0ABX8B437_9BACT|nr:carboxypeptidase-like regulatory domain-containing protein [Chloracidobacterium aggregatum]QUV86491.1 TonB-dependent receptor [Chloracidobacterium sp. 2]QUV89079.1 TonB-dependent receptor [Chloracidobacterium sp. S]QUV92115.1 TonB-dependent receptor [Chloracidobacterium sp. A]QUV95387.1 TonB-dependent receptor [Chloracidobacterium sp. N]QUV98612.1 TonB-dependent receptor [Chloracidobacterium sp. E]